MINYREFFIGGEWTSPRHQNALPVINPATEEELATISLGDEQDVAAAVQAAKTAFKTYGKSSRNERLALLKSVIEKYQVRIGEVAETISKEMGAPIGLSTQAQAASGLAHLSAAHAILEAFPFEEERGSTQIIKEPIGVCGFITPWNWPINQIACKVAPALATGCTAVLKPSEIAPLSAMVFADILREAGLPPGVFNLLNGAGPTVGQAIAAHPDIDMVSFTGSNRGGIAVAKAAADSVKRVSQELGGKSAHIILDDADLQSAVNAGVMGCMLNSGQSCNAPTRMLAPTSCYDEVVAIAKAAAENIVVGDPFSKATTIGPVASDIQWNKIQSLIKTGIEEGATLVTGGPGRPSHLACGYYIKPTIFSGVRNNMTIAREEIFGPVLPIIPYKDEEDAISIANDTGYGLSGYVSSGNIDRARRVARQLRTGMVHLNDAPLDFEAPFGGYKQSGNGREWGKEGFDEFLEVKAVMGYRG